METLEQKADRWGVSVEDVILHQKIRIAALQEAGVYAAASTSLHGWVATRKGTPCQVRFKASQLANQAIGRAQQTSAEWHEANHSAALAEGQSWTCNCGELD